MAIFAMAIFSVARFSILTGPPAQRVAGKDTMRLAGHVMRNDGPYFDRAHAHGWDADGEADGLVQIFGFDQIVAAELLLGLREGTIGDQTLAVAQPDGRGFRGCVQLVTTS